MTPDPRAAAWFDTVSIMPISPGAKIPYKGFGWTDLQKTPATPEVRAEWKKEYPGCNWALITGAVSGIVALDWDKEKGRELRKEKNVYGGPASITPRGGFHTLHRHPGREIQNKARLIGDETGGLDIRGDGGYIVIPPSVFEGKSYKWEIAPWMIEAPPLPEWALELIERKTSTAPTVAVPEGNGEADGLPAGVGEGQRNDMAARLAGRYLAKGLSAEEAYSILSRWNRKNRPALSEEELRATIFNIARREAEKNVPLEVIGAADLVQGTFEAREMLIRPFFPSGGKAILAGNSGTGKTLLAENLSYSIANEIPLFERFDVSRGKVLYVDSESTRDLARVRVAKIRNGLHVAHAGVSFIFPGKRLDLGIQRNREDLCRLIDREKSTLCILDSFLCFASLRSENDNSEVRGFLENLSDIPKATGAALLILDHAAKASPERAKSGIGVTARGAGAKHDWADVVLTFEERKNELKFLRTLRFAKTRFCSPVPAMILEMDANLVFRPSGEDEICPIFTVRQVVEENPGIAAGALYLLLSSTTGSSVRTAMRSTARATELGMILREERGTRVKFHPPAAVKEGAVTNAEDPGSEGDKLLEYQ